MAWYIEEQERIYLDYNATTPLEHEVENAIAESMKYWANPSSNSPLGEQFSPLPSSLIYSNFHVQFYIVTCI